MYHTALHTHVNISAHVSANECFLLSELLASNEGVYFHRVQWRKIEHVYCSVYSSPFHSHSCVNMTELQFQTVSMCVCQSCKRRGNNKVNAPLNKDVDMVCVNTTGPLPWLQIVIYECKDFSGLPRRLVCGRQLPGHQADGLAGRWILHCMNLVKLSQTNCAWWVATEATLLKSLLPRDAVSGSNCQGE